MWWDVRDGFARVCALAFLIPVNFILGFTFDLDLLISQ
jgi:hypothetical protein